MSVLLLILLFAVLFLVFVSVILFVVGPSMLLHPYRRTVDYYRRHTTILHPSDLGVPYDELTLKTAEGIPLKCWLLPVPDGARGTVIILHGVSECMIAGLPMARLLHRHGFNVLLYDSRRHGESGGSYCTYGFYEKHDTSTIISYLLSRSDLRVGRIGLFGTSMGAAVALQVAAIDSRVAAVIAESGFSRLRTIFDDYQRRMIKIPFHYLRNIVIKRSESVAHFRANAVVPSEAVRDVHVPVFFIHGAADTTILPQYSEQVFNNANHPKELWLIPGGTHSNVPDVGGEEYRKRIVEFFERWLVEPPPYRENQ